MGKTGIWTISCFYPLQLLKNIEKQATDWFLTDCLKFRGKKETFYLCCCQVTTICFNEPDYITLATLYHERNDRKQHQNDT